MAFPCIRCAPSQTHGLINESDSEIKEELGENVSAPTLNRDLTVLVGENCLARVGKGRATYYEVSPIYKVFFPLNNSPEYFNQDPDARKARTQFNSEVISLLGKTDLFNAAERKYLEALKQEYQSNISDYPSALFQKELERLTIELSWKSSQIEGNTYSLLETERLFREKEEADGKPKEDAIMLLNHKYALDYLLAQKGIAEELNLRLLEEIHALLIKDLNVGRNIRSRTVGITGTAYKPLDNQYQIKEAVEHMCEIINAKDNGFEKALLAVVLISYIFVFTGEIFCRPHRAQKDIVGLFINRQVLILCHDATRTTDYERRRNRRQKKIRISMGRA